MKNFYYRYCAFILILLLPFVSYSQTPGFIYKPATGGGEKVLDPNGNGYISITTSGFSGTNDVGPTVSEIPYRPLPVLDAEVIGDLNTGSAGGHTDLAPPSPVQAYFDGRNLMFRLRLGGTSTSSKGYSVLIDADNQFGNLVAGGNPATTPNPGFEFEIILESNFSVAVYDHRNNASGGPKIWSGSVDQYSQRAVAATTNSGNPDYFYDYYVPLSALPGITANTPLRMSGVTITSAQSGITGTVSDVGGVNFQNYEFSKQKAWAAIINTFPPTTLNQINSGGFGQVIATAPVVSGPILANSTSISGSSVEAAGSVVTVLRNGVAICGGAGQPACPTVSANGTWTLTGLSGNLLQEGNSITAQVTPAGKSISPASSPVTVTAGVCIATPPPVITNLGGSGNTNRSFIGTTTFNSFQRITIYSSAGTVIGSFLFTPSGSSPFTWTSPEFAIAENNYYATVTPVNSTNTATTGCESLRSNQICFRNGQPRTNLQQISITSVTYNGVTQTSANSTFPSIPTNVASISGTLTAAPSNIASGTTGYIAVFVNAVEQVSLRTTIQTTATTWSIAIPAGALTLKAGDVLNVRTVWTLTGGGQTTCPTPSSISNLLRVTSTTAAPIINAGPYCGTVSSISGTSTEPAGTVVEIYQNGVATGRTGIVTTAGTWTVDLSPLSGGGIAPGVSITARASSTGKATSIASNTVTSAARPTGALTITGPITEGQTTISGTAPAGAQVTLFIEGTPFTPVTANASGNWSVVGLSALEVFAGATVTASYKEANPCESARISPLIVQCSPPRTNFTITASPTTICGGATTNITLSGSEYGISYRVLVNGVESGSSVIGTGSGITLTSGPITNTTASDITATITVRARKVTGTACDATLSSSTTVTVRPQPATTGLSFSSNTLTTCANQPVTFTLNGTVTGNTYRLFNEGTGQLVGSAVTGTGGSISLVTNNITANTTFALVVTSTANGCPLTLPSQVTAIITSPSTTRAVFPTASKVCAGGATLINVSTEPNNDYEYIVYRRPTGANGLSGNQVLGTFRGNGNIITTNTGVLSAVGTETFFVTVRNLTGTCGVLNLVNEATIQVTNNATAANAGPAATVCGTTATLAANDVSPGIGTWSRVSGPTTVTFSSPNNPNATVQNLASGVYVLRWTVQTTCGGTTTTTQSDVTITVNCDATYALAVPNYKDKYNNGDIIATPSDPDGAITIATILQGTLPPGTSINSTSGIITVTNRAALTEGTYNLTVRLTDALGGVTTIPIVLRIYGNSPTVVPLPVELVSFTAIAADGIVTLTWITASETDNSHFEVQRSLDGKSFESIAKVEGNGNSSQRIKYEYKDTSPLANILYYRLMQVDINGDFEYSNIVAVDLSYIKTAGNSLEVYPVPFENTLNIRVRAAQDKTAQIVLVDLQGREVYKVNYQLVNGLNSFEVNVPPLPDGVYLIQLRSNGETMSRKIMKAR